MERNLAESKKRLNALIEKMNKSAGSKVLGFASDPEIREKLEIKKIPFPSIRLNKLVGGGLPKGKTTMIMGEPDSGKTMVLLETIGLQMQQDPNFIALWLESESSLELSAMTEMFKIDLERFVYIEIDSKASAEGALDQIIALIKAEPFDIAVINSVKCLTPSKEFDDSMKDQNIGLQARMMSKFTRKVTALASNQGTALVLVNHKTTDIGKMYGDNLVPAAGRALRYSSLLILDFAGRSVLDADPVKKDTHKKIGVKVFKNHCAQKINPYESTVYYVKYGVGTDTTIETIDILIESGEINRAGAWFSVIDENTGDPIEFNGMTLKWQGKDSVIKAIQEDAELREFLFAKANGNEIEFEKLTEEEISEIESINNMDEAVSNLKATTKKKKTTKKKDEEVAE